MRAAVGVAITIAAWTSVARADGDIAARLADANHAYEALDYEDAIAGAAAIAGDDAATAPQRIDARLLEALAHLALIDPADAGSEENAVHRDAADHALRAVVELDWEFELPAGYPAELRAAMALAREAVEREHTRIARERCARVPTMAVEAPARPRGGKALALTFRLADPGACAEVVRVTWGKDRVTGSSQARSLLPIVGGVARLVLPAETTASARPFDLAYYAEAYDAQHGELASVGSFAQPEHLGVAAGALPRPLYKRWWFWTAIGAAAVGAAFAVDQLRDVGPQMVTVDP